MENATQIQFMSQILVEGFGDKAPEVFAQLRKKINSSSYRRIKYCI